MALDWVEITVKVAGPPFAASDLSDGHCALTNVAFGAYSTIGLDALQAKQASRPTGQF
jgi:hypothetical protein